MGHVASQEHLSPKVISVQLGAKFLSGVSAKLWLLPCTQPYIPEKETGPSLSSLTYQCRSSTTSRRGNKRGRGRSACMDRGPPSQWCEGVGRKHPSHDVILFSQKMPRKSQKVSYNMTSFEQALLASQEMIISSQSCSTKLQRFFFRVR